MRQMSLVLMGTRGRVWALAALWCVLGALSTYRAFAGTPVPSPSVAFGWALVVFWLAMPLLVIWRHFSETAEDTFAVRYTAVRFALLGYVPLWITMNLLTRYVAGR